MNALAFITFLASALIFAVPSKLKWHLTFALQLLVAAITGWAAFNVLMNETGVLDIPFIYLIGSQVHLVIDGLSAFFILVVNFTAITGGLYAIGYLKPYSDSKNATELSLHLFCFLWLHISMVLVCMLRDGLAFLITWEMMAITSFVLVIFESDKKEAIRIGINYLIQMHVALILIIAAFVHAYVTGSNYPKCIRFTLSRSNGYRPRGAVPPSGLFVSELMVFKSLFAGNHYFISILVLFLLFVIIFVFGRNFMQLLYSTDQEGRVTGTAVVNKGETASQFILITIIIYLAFWPPSFFTDLINSAIVKLI